jgi:class 3 adenylate cyclase
MSQDQASQLFRPYLSAWLREQFAAREIQPGFVATVNAAILYADLSGFTQLTAAYAALPDGAECLHDALNRCYTVLTETIGAFGGDVAAIAGDALTAWWPGSTEIEPARRCGSAMLAAVAALPPLQTPAGPFRLELRIGVSVGVAHAALAGLPSHGVHLVISGPALSAAAAAERNGPPGTLQIAPPTVRAESGLTATQPCGAGPALSWESFVPPGFAERLRLNDHSAEYRRCVPVFAAFTLPASPEELHPLVAQVQTVVMRWGGWLNEIEVGDKGSVFVLLFGAPVARGDDPSRAVGCCLELLERGLIRKAGITLGILFVGAVGSQRRRVYTAQGDDMNLAAHLMLRADEGAILVSGRVRHDVMDRYATSPPEVIATKGHAAGVPVARVVAGGARGEQAGVTHRRYLADGAALVGRERERGAIEETAAIARAGRPRLLLVEGESGIGKSCVIQDLFLRWVQAGGAGFRAECSSGGAPTPLLAWRTILADMCGLDEGAPPRQQLAALEEALGALPERARAGAPRLVAALGLSGARAESAPPQGGDPDDHLAALVAALVARQAASRPLLIVIEDLHWADEASLRLADEVVRRCAGLPLLVALSHRPLDGAEPSPLAALRANPAAAAVTIGRLSSDESAALIRAQLGVAVVHEDLRRQVERHTEGQPLFIKEYLRVLRQHHLIVVEDNAARLVRSYVTVQVSSSAQGVIQARVDRLDAQTRLTLKVAAVLGRSFSLRLLGTIHPARPAPETLRAQLDTLTALQIIDVELADPERVYRFKHGITHEVAYTSLLFGQRRQLHGAVADWYEAAHGAEVASGRAAMVVFDVLTDHLGRAEQWARLAHYARIAAVRAAGQSATTVALRYLEQALLYTADPAVRLELLLLRVAVNDRVGNYVGQADDLHEIAGLAPAADPLPRAYATLYRLRYLLAIGATDAVQQQAPRALRALQRPELKTCPPQALAALGAAITEAHAAARAAGGAPEAARSLYRHALTLCLAGDGPGQHASFAVDTRTVASRALDGLGRLERAAGRPAEAVAHQRGAIALAELAGDWCAETLAREGLGRALLAQESLDAAYAEARVALHTSNAVGDRGGQARALRLLAAISAARGDYAAAGRDAHYALANSAGALARHTEAAIWEEIAGYAAAQGQPDEAAAARQEAARARSGTGPHPGGFEAAPSAPRSLARERGKPRRWRG